MEILAGYCKDCKGELIRAKNSWNGIGNLYFSPVHAPLGSRGIEEVGEIYESTAGTRIEGCQLQNVACRKCHMVVGVKCQASPSGHLLKPGQLLLKLDLISLSSEGSGRPAKISVLQTVALSKAQAKKSSAIKRASTVQPMSRKLPTEPQAQAPKVPAPVGRFSERDSTNNPPTSSHSKPDRNTSNSSGVTENSLSSLGKDTSTSYGPMSDDSSEKLEKFKSWAEKTISAQQEDIDRISGAIKRLEGGMRTLQDTIQDIRTDINSTIKDQNLKREQAQQKTQNEFERLHRRVANKERDLDGQIQQYERQSELFELDRSNQEDSIKAIRREVHQIKARADKGGSNSDFQNATVLLHEKLERVTRDVSRISRLQAVDDLKLLVANVAERLQGVEKAIVAQPALRPENAKQTRPSGIVRLKRQHTQPEVVSTPSGESPAELRTKRRRTRESRATAIDFNHDVRSSDQGAQVHQDEAPFNEEPHLRVIKPHNSSRPVVYLDKSPPRAGSYITAADSESLCAPTEAPLSEPKPIRKLIAEESNNRRTSLRGIKPKKSLDGK